MTRSLLGAMGMNEWELRLLLDRAEALAAQSLDLAAKRGIAAPADADADARMSDRIGLVALAGDGDAAPAQHAATLILGGVPVVVPLTAVMPIRDAISPVNALSPALTLVGHSRAGVAARMAAALPCPVVAVRDGPRESLAEALALALAVRQALGSVQGRHVALLGDARRSGAARSALIVLGALGARLRLVAPSALLPSGAASFGAAVHTGVEDGLRGVEAVIVLPPGGDAPDTPVNGSNAHHRRFAFPDAPTDEAAIIGTAADMAGAAMHDDRHVDPATFEVPVLMALMLTAMGVER